MLRYQFKMNLPEDVMRWVSAEAGKECRSKSAQIIFVLRSAMAAGGSFGDQAPAAEINGAALPGGVSINHGKGDTEDECPNG